MLVKQLVCFLILHTFFIFTSCKNEVTAPDKAKGDIIFSQLGLVDSAVVYGCYPRIERFFVDTLYLDSFSKLKVEFDGYANSDGSYIKVFYNTDSISNVEIYSVEDIAEVNKFHTFGFTRPDNVIWMELRIYINPPICGEGEFKYTRARDLSIYGIR